MVSMGGTKKQYLEEVEKEREALTKEIRAELFTQVSEEVQKTFERSRPPREDREQAAELLRELEFDSMAYARACTTEAEAIVSRAQVFKPFHRAFIYVMSIGLLPFIYFGGHRFNWIADGALTNEAWFTVLPAVVALGIALITYFAGADKVKTLSVSLQRRAKLYTDVYEGARHARKVRASVVNRAELASLTAEFVRSKQQADNIAEAPIPPLALDRARQEVRDLLVVEVDPEKLWRAPTSETEDTPAAVEDEPQDARVART